jgi:DNA polymerase (family 10)
MEESSTSDRPRVAELPAEPAEEPPAGGLPEPEARADSTDRLGPEEPAVLSNGQLARVFHEIGDMLEVKGELVYKTVAYHKAADAIAHSPVEVAQAYLDGRPPRIPGVGEAIARKIEELARTGHLAFYERLREEVPPSLVALLEIPGVGPRTVRQLHEELSVETLDDLRRAAEAGALRSLKGMSEKTEQQVLAGIAALETRLDRMRLGQAEAIVETLLAELAGVPGLRSIQPAGSYRRRRETIGDLDLLAETDRPQELVERFATLGSVDRVLGRGPHKAAIRLLRGPQVDLMIMPPGQAGTYLIHFTGSKEHNVRLRGMARDRGWSLSEKGFLRLGPNGEPPEGETGAADDAPEPATDTPAEPGDGTERAGGTGPTAAAELRTFETEAEAYAFLGLPFIEPELRENRGEIEAALAGTLPRLVTRADLRGDCHSHSDWSDGVHSIEQMAEAARRRGYSYLVLSDHTISLAIARGLDLERVERQRAIVAALNARFAREEAEGTAPAGTSAEGFRLLHGCELEVRADATLDYPDELLARYDFVVASVHVGRRQPREQLTSRTLAAIRNPNVDVIAHPAGRYIGTRDDLDLDWDTIYREAARTGTALELNGSDERLDLSDVRARRASEFGCVFTIDSDAHRIEELDNLRWGTAMARRAWLTADLVLNTRSRAELLTWVAGKPARVDGPPATRVGG